MTDDGDYGDDETHEHTAALENKVIELMQELVEDYDYERADLERLVEAAA